MGENPTIIWGRINNLCIIRQQKNCAWKNMNSQRYANLRISFHSRKVTPTWDSISPNNAAFNIGWHKFVYSLSGDNWTMWCLQIPQSWFQYIYRAIIFTQFTWILHKFFTISRYVTCENIPITTLENNHVKEYHIHNTNNDHIRSTYSILMTPRRKVRQIWIRSLGTMVGKCVRLASNS